jgi:hypothetical protein
MDLNSIKRILEEKRIKELQSSNKPQLPSIANMAFNVGQSIARNVQSVAAGNSLNLPADEANKRLNICKGCEFFLSEQSRCSKCGCYMAVKTYLKAERCPVGKW